MIKFLKANIVAVLVTFPLLVSNIANAGPVYAHQQLVNIAWTQEEKEQNIAIKHLERNEHMSSHLVRIQGKEPPHVHDHHDMVVTVISGSSVLHLADTNLTLHPGDIIMLSKGEFHWVENIGEDASVAHVVFSPPFDGKDRRIVDPK